MIATLGDVLEKFVFEVAKTEGGALRARRRDKFLAIGKKGLG